MGRELAAYRAEAGRDPPARAARFQDRGTLGGDRRPPANWLGNGCPQINERSCRIPAIVEKAEAMNALYAAALEAQQFMQRNGWRLCIIGGVAVVRWGAPRLTQDVDFTLLTELGREDTFIDRLMENFQPRIPNARQFAL